VIATTCEASLTLSCKASLLASDVSPTERGARIEEARSELRWPTKCRRACVAQCLFYQVRRTLAPPGRFEHPTVGLEGRCSIQLSYGGWAPVRLAARQRARA
jgi:hypothetical protein